MIIKAYRIKLPKPVHTINIYISMQKRDVEMLSVVKKKKNIHTIIHVVCVYTDKKKSQKKSKKGYTNTNNRPLPHNRINARS